MRNMPELEIVEVPVGELLMYEHNSKIHTHENIDNIANSIERFGYVNPVLAWHNDEGDLEIVGGHGRVMAAKTIQTGIPLFGSTIALPGAAVCYAVTFLMTDVVGQIWGRKEAQTIVYWGFCCQVLATLLIIFTQALPATEPAMQAAYDMLLGQNIVFVIGSMVAYFASQSWDVFVFHKIREMVLAKGGSDKMRAIWNNASTMTSQIIDTVLFVGIAFGLGFGWLFDAAMLPTLGAMMVGQYILKFLLAAIDTPIFYLLTRKAGKDGERAELDTLHV